MTVYIEKSHPKIYTIISILLPNLYHDIKIASTFRIVILTPRMSLKQRRMLHDEKNIYFFCEKRKGVSSIEGVIKITIYACFCEPTCIYLFAILKTMV